MSDFRVCAVVPTYDNPQTVARVVRAVQRHLPITIVVDDGSHAPARGVLDRLASELGIVLLRHSRNRGKGAAMKTGLREAAMRGFTHALQVDADGQHLLDDIPRFMSCARDQPSALVLGAPRFDATCPRLRGYGHWLTSLWVRIETSSRAIKDPQCGFRVYPVAAARAVRVRGNRMDFDPEIAVRLHWHGTPIVNLSTHVRYLESNEGGVSHFHMGLDNLLITWMHVRLVVLAILRGLLRPFRRAA